MTFIKVSEATPTQLDWLVAKCENHKGSWIRDDMYGNHVVKPYEPTTDWSQGGPIIERERIDVFSIANGTGWCAQSDLRVSNGYGTTPLIAAMRCYVVSKLGDTAEVPEELT